MNIVVLDGYTTNPGDLNWAGFEALGQLTVHERSSRDEVIPRASEADIVLTNKTPLTAAVLAELPRLRYVGVLATGVNVVDVAAASDRGICVTNVPGYGTQSVAQHTLALILELTNRVGHHSAGVRVGGWANAADWCYWEFPLTELAGLTLGIVGYGRIGGAVARLGSALGMRVLASARRARAATDGVTFVALEELLAQSDVVSLHCPLTAETERMINATTLRLMKSTAYLVNTSRGPLIDEEALADALERGELGGAALDVLSVEPPSLEHRLAREPRCVITPHQAWATLAARRRLLEVAAQNLAGFLAGSVQNQVS